MKAGLVRPTAGMARCESTLFSLPCEMKPPSARRGTPLRMRAAARAAA